MDLIERKAAIDALSVVNDSICRQQAIDALYELPSAQPEAKLIAKITVTDEQIQKLFEKVKHEAVYVIPEIIRCKDCKWSDWYTCEDGVKRCYCMEHGSSGHDGDDYCSYAEREEDE